MNLLLIVFPFMFGGTPNLVVTSSAFANKDIIPMKYTCEGANMNPPLSVKNIPPEKTKSLAIIMDDPDATDSTFTHWVIWNIHPDNIEHIDEGAVKGVHGRNSKGDSNYTGPCPPNGEHNYHFKVYALDAMLELPAGSGKNDLINAMQGHIVATGELIGTYKKKNKKS